jgi:hypothetical protein
MRWAYGGLQVEESRLSFLSFMRITTYFAFCGSLLHKKIVVGEDWVIFPLSCFFSLSLMGVQGVASIESEPSARFWCLPYF